MPAGDPNRAVLFYTCSVNYNDSEIGRDTVEVFSKSGISLGVPKQNCCGMPAVEAGDLEMAKRLAGQNVAGAAAARARGKKVVAIDPTCSYMLRRNTRNWPARRKRAKVAAAAMDICEFLFVLKQEGKFNRDFRSTPGAIAYHLLAICARKYRLPFARHDAPDPGRQGHANRTMLRPRRHLGDEEGVLSTLSASRQKSVRGCGRNRRHCLG